MKRRSTLIYAAPRGIQPADPHGTSNSAWRTRHERRRLPPAGVGSGGLIRGLGFFVLCGVLLTCGTAVSAEPSSASRFGPNHPLRQPNTIHVAPDGRDRASGFSPREPVRTVEQGYDRLRDGTGDRLLLKRGGTYSLPETGQGDFRQFRKSGLDEQTPLTIGAWGDADQPRPVVLTHGRGFIQAYAPVSHVVVRNLDVRATDPAEDGTELAVVLKADIHDLTFERVRFQDYWQHVNIDGLNRSLHDITFRRCQFLRAHGAQGHPQGLSAGRMRGLRIVGCFFDHNGWLQPEDKTMFRHHVYLYQCRDVRIERSAFARESYNAVKVRSDEPRASRDITIDNNLFFQTLCAIKVHGDPEADPEGILHENINITDNVITAVGGAIPAGRRGHGILISRVADCRIGNNLLVHGGAGGAWSAIMVRHDRPHGRVEIAGNVIDDWLNDRGRVPLIRAGPEADVHDNVLCPPRRWRTLVGYARRHGLEGLAGLCRALGQGRIEPTDLLRWMRGEEGGAAEETGETPSLEPGDGSSPTR